MAYLSSDHDVSITPCTWIDIDVYPHERTVTLMPRNHNRQWLYQTSSSPRPRPSLVPWHGAPTHSFNGLKSTLQGRIARAVVITASEPVAVYVALEFMLELWLIGYPRAYLRALAHALPAAGTAAVPLRRVIRPWLKAMGRQ